jgi:transposase
MSIIPETKYAILRRQSNLHSRPQNVQDALFRTHPFFDPHDLLQVKYEMLRRIRVEGMQLGAAAAVFGFSRPTTYQAQALFQRHGLLGLMPNRPGPRHCHKLTDEVTSFIRQQREFQPTLSVVTLSARVQSTFGLRVHPRSVERALARPGKKTTPSRPIMAKIGGNVSTSHGLSAMRTCVMRP